MHVQEAIQLIGQKRRYHVLVLTILALNFMFVSLHIFSDLFLRLEPAHHCKLPENGTKEEWIPYKPQKKKFYSCHIYSEPLTAKEVKKYHPDLYPKSEKSADVVKRAIPEHTEQTLGYNSSYGSSDKYKKEHMNKRKKLECTDYEYEDQTRSTMITEWRLSCMDDRRIFASTVICVAMLLGGIMFAPFVDKLGRKTLFMMCCVQNTLLAIGVTFVGDFNSYLVLRFLSRLYIEGVEVALLVWAVELVPAENRPLAPFVLFIAYSLGHCLLPILAYFITNWRHFQLVIGLSSAVMIPVTSFLVPESFNWLVSAHRKQEAEKIIRRAARFNGIALPSHFNLDDMAEDDKHGEQDGGGEGHGCATAASRLQHRTSNMSMRHGAKQGAGDYMQHEIHAHLGHWTKLLDMMKNRQLRKHFAIVSYVWAVVGFLYFGLTTSTMESKGNVYLNYGLSAVALIPACISVFLIMRRFGRKKPIMTMLFGCGVSVIGSTLCPVSAPDGTDLYPLYLLLKMLAKYTTFSALVSIRLLIIEIYPTPVRGSLVGLTAFFGLLGSGLGYYYSVMLNFSKYVGVGAGGLALLAGALCRLLPETSNRPLPDTIHDVMEAYRDVFINMLGMMGGMGNGMSNGAGEKRPSRVEEEDESMLKDGGDDEKVEEKVEAPVPALLPKRRVSATAWMPDV